MKGVPFTNTGLNPESWLKQPLYGTCMSAVRVIVPSRDSGSNRKMLKEGSSGSF